MNLPNSLTTARILLIPPLVGVLLGSDSPTRETVGFLVFAVAAATDYLDGYLARRRSQITAVGQLLDPIADKLLISAAFISLVELDLVPAWMVIVVVGREFAVTGLRSAAARRGLTISASRLGKYKMAAQVACVGCLIVADRFPTIHFNPFPEYLTLYRLGQILLWIVVFLAVLSMVQYFRKFWSMIDTGDPAQDSLD